MKRHFLFLLHFFLVITPLAAQIDFKIPSWVNKIEPKPVSINKNDVIDGFYYSLIDEQYNSVTKQNYFHYAKVVVNEEALTTVSQIEFSYDPSYQKATLHFVRIIRGNEIIDKTKSLDFKILNEENRRNVGLLEGRKTFYTNLSDIRKGDIIEYAFSVNGKNPIMGNYFNYTLQLGYSEPIGQLYYRILFPNQTTPKTLQKNTTVKPIVKTTTSTDYVWNIINPPLIKIDPNTPSWYDPYPTVQISNLKDWNEVKVHGRSLMKLPDYDKTLLNYTVDSIVKLNSSTLSQISTLVDFVQKHIRYSGNESGIYSHIPRTPDIILKNRFGDCKEKSVLLNELLKLIHIEAYPVFINTTLREKTAEQLPCINAFDHCISSFTYEHQLYFIDPTISYQSGNFKLRILPSYGTGMIIDEQPQPFTIIPIDSSSSTKIIEEFDEVDSLDSKLKVTSTFKGTNADDTRYYFHSNSLNAIQEASKKFYTKYGEQIQVLDTITFTDKSETNEIVTVEHYLIKRFWATNDSSADKIIKKDFIPYSLNYRLVYGDEVTRKDPLQLDYPFNFSQTLIINHKTGWNIENDEKHEKNRFFDYTYTTNLDGNTLKLAYTYTNHAGVISPKDYSAYNSKMDFINHNIVLSIVEDPTIGQNNEFNWSLLLAFLFGIGLASVFVWYLNKHRYASRFENRYPSIEGWLILVGIGVVIAPLSYIFQIYSRWDEAKNIDYFYYYFNEESLYFSPIRGYYILFTNFFSTMILVYTVFIVTAFFQKRAAFRIHYFIYKLITFLFILIDVIVIYINNASSATTANKHLLVTQSTTLFGMLISGCIWVPYVWFSERSRHTFTNETG